MKSVIIIISLFFGATLAWNRDTTSKSGRVEVWLRILVKVALLLLVSFLAGAVLAGIAEALASLVIPWQSPLAWAFTFLGMLITIYLYLLSDK